MLPVTGVLVPPSTLWATAISTSHGKEFFLNLIKASMPTLWMTFYSFCFFTGLVYLESTLEGITRTEWNLNFSQASSIT